MKKIIFGLIIAAAFSNHTIFSYEFYLKIYYLQGEKSKDSHSSEENITIKGNNVAYSIVFGGQRGENDIDMEKSCTFTKNNIENIKNTIILGELNVIDSLFEEDTKYKSFEQYCNIAIDIELGGNPYSIRINGDIEEFKNKNLYKNSLFLISMIKEMLSECKS
jgi:hypothetical protein